MLPNYQEHFVDVAMNEEMQMHYHAMELDLMPRLKQALVAGDQTLLGVVMNAILAWPAGVIPALFDAQTPSPKECELIRLVKANKQKGRRTLVYTVWQARHRIETESAAWR